MKMTLKQLIEAFQQTLRIGLERIQRAGEIYVQALDQFKDAKKEFEKTIPEYSNKDWANLEKLGRKQIIPELLFDFSPCARKLTMMPITSQKQIYGKVLPLITSTGDTLNVQFKDASPKQTRQLFAKDHVRTPSEQRAWIETNIKKQKKASKSKYKFVNGKVIFETNTPFTKDELIYILGRM